MKAVYSFPHFGKLALILFLQVVRFPLCQCEEGSDVTTASDVVPPLPADRPTIPPIYIMNLNRAVDRWESAKKEMKNAGVEYNRFEAVDGRSLSNTELQSQSTVLATFLQPRGVIGCYLSHRNFWKMVVDQKLESAIVFEDDVQLVPNFKNLLSEKLLASKNVSFDVILLGAIGLVHPDGKHNVAQNLFSIWIGGSKPVKRINEHIYQPTRPAGTHAYMVSYEGAKKLLDLCPKAVFHVDLDAWRHRSLNIYIFEPMLAYQHFASTSLTTSKRGSLSKIFDNKRFMDPLTKQTWSHVLSEPLMQCGLEGPVITVESSIKVVASGVTLAALLQSLGYRNYARVAYGSVVAFIVSIKSVIWLLMNWK